MSALHWTWVATLPIFSGVLLAVLAISIRAQRQTPIGRSFLLFIFATSIWSWAYLGELCAMRQDAAVFWANVEYFGIPTTPVAFFLFARLLSGGKVSRRMLAVLGAACAVIWTLVWTDGSHHLLRPHLRFVSYGTYRVLDFHPGPAWLANLAFSYFLIGVAIVNVVRMAQRRDSLSQKHAQLVLLGLFLPVVGNVARLFGYEPIRGIDQTPILFSLTAVTIGYGIFRWSLISVAPIARDKVVDGLSDAVLVVDPKGWVVDANAAAARLFSLTREELFRAKQEDLANSLPTGALGGESDTVVEVGERAYMRRRTPLSGAGGAALGTLYQFTDITDQRKLEATLRRAKELAEEASDAKSRFVAHISHELRTPLNGVIGLSGMLGDTRLDPAQQDYLKGIRQCSETLLGLVNDVLDLSKLEADSMPLEREPIDVARLAREIADVHRYAAEEKGLRLEVEAIGLPSYIESDSLRLRQILNNLIGNAVKFTEKGYVRLEVARDGDWLELRVSDTGIGILDSMHEAVMEPFQQADESTTREYGGTGLGLPITRALVARMGGELSLQSEIGVGTTLVARLPLVEAAKPDAPVPTDEVRPGIRVLVAEDNEVNALVITHLLSRLGCEVTHCVDGAETLEAFAAEEFDLVLLDLQMPVLDGFQVARAIRERWPDRPTRVYALTANAFEEERRNAMDAGMDGFLTKPIRLPELAAVLHETVPH